MASSLSGPEILLMGLYEKGEWSTAHADMKPKGRTSWHMCCEPSIIRRENGGIKAFLLFHSSLYLIHTTPSLDSKYRRSYLHGTKKVLEIIHDSLSVSSERKEIGRKPKHACVLPGSRPKLQRDYDMMCLSLVSFDFQFSKSSTDLNHERLRRISPAYPLACPNLENATFLLYEVWVSLSGLIYKPSFWLSSTLPHNTASLASKSSKRRVMAPKAGRIQQMSSRFSLRFCGVRKENCSLHMCVCFACSQNLKLRNGLPSRQCGLLLRLPSSSNSEMEQ
jgi:hypothetical protein